MCTHLWELQFLNFRYYIYNYFCRLLFLCVFVFLLKYSWFITLYKFQVYSKMIYVYTYIFFQVLYPYRLIQNTEYSFLCYRVVVSCLLSILYIVDWVTSLSLFTFMQWRRKWQPTPVFLPGEPQGWGSLVGCHLWGCTESDTTEAT